MSSPATPLVYQFADCTLDTVSHTLVRTGQRQVLAAKVYEVLLYLLLHRERVISKQELCETVWEGTHITDAAMESCLRTVRRSVGDSGRAQQVIRTLRSYGYQFIAEVDAGPDTPPEPDVPAASSAPSVAERPSPVTVPEPPAPVVEWPTLPGGGLPCRACTRPNPPEGLFCTACGVRLGQVCPVCGRGNTAAAAFCAACGQPLDASPGDDGSPLGTSTAEQKPVTVLWCTLGLDGMDLETSHALLTGLRTRLQELLRQYDGQAYPGVGGQVGLLFGLHITQEDAARRAVQVAWALQQALPALAAQAGLPPTTLLVWRMGLHTAPEIVDPESTHSALTFPPTLAGEAATLAAALQAQAAPGALVCSAATAALIDVMAELTRLAPCRLPGRAAPLDMYHVGGPRPPAPSFVQRRQRVLSPFVGRANELAQLHTALEEVTQGRGRVVGLVGEAGLGKSRLLYEFRQRLGAAPVTYVSGRCLSHATRTPYGAVGALLRQTCGVTETDPPAVVTAQVQQQLAAAGLDPATWTPALLRVLDVALPHAPAPVLTPEAQKTQTLTAVTRLWLQGSQQRPLILEVEDLHWIDASSEDCLMTLVDRLAGAPLLLLLTYRPDYHPVWLQKSYATQMALRPLTAAESHHVVVTTVPEAVYGPPVVARLVAQADGNPFFLEELALAVVAQGAEAVAHAVPPTVQAVLQTRIDRLPPLPKRLLRAAAAIGREVPWTLLQAVVNLPEPQVAPVLTTLQQAELLYETYTARDLAYTFKHALTQEVTYQSLVRRTRVALHARIAQVLETTFPELVETQPEVLAHHCTEGNLLEPAWQYWQRAGHRAVTRSANVEAIGHFTHALEVLSRLPIPPARTQQELGLLLALGSPLLMIEGHTTPRVAQTYQRALTLCAQLGDTPEHVAALMGLWRLYFSRADLRRARALSVDCFQLAERLHEPVALHEAHLALGSTLFHLGELQTAWGHLHAGSTLYAQEPRCRALAWQRGIDTGVTCLARGAWALWLLGYPQQALTRVYEALALAEEIGHPYSVGFARHFVALVHRSRREPEAVLTQAEAMLKLSEAQGFVLWHGGGLFLRGWALAEQGDLHTGIAHLQEGLRIWQTMGNDLGRTIMLAFLAEMHGKAEDYAQGLGLVEEALRVGETSAEQHHAAELWRIKGDLLLQRAAVTAPSQRQARHADEQEAERCLLQALAIAHAQEARSCTLRAAMSLGRWQAHQGQRQEARQLLHEAYAWFTEGFDTPDLQDAKALLATFA